MVSFHGKTAGAFDHFLSFHGKFFNNHALLRKKYFYNLINLMRDFNLKNE